jgi:hypothetical protein
LPVWQQPLLASARRLLELPAFSLLASSRRQVLPLVWLQVLLLRF